MSKILLTGLLAFCLLTSVAAGVKVKSWFNVAKCEKLVINRYKAGMGKKPTHVIEIGDANAIERLKRRIQSISADGEVMRSSIVDEEIQLSFECGDQKSVIEIYDGKFKTPTTGGLLASDVALFVGPRLSIDTSPEGLHRQDREGGAEDAHHGHRRRSQRRFHDSGFPEFALNQIEINVVGANLICL